MKSTVKSLLESEFGPEIDVITENNIMLNKIESLNEEQVELLGFTPEKVIVLKSNDRFLIEFSNNIERLMRDQMMSLEEAVESISEANDISYVDIDIVVDESCINKVDLKSLTESQFTFLRK